jgi:uncharacterized protein
VVKVKVGPITAQYKGAARIVEADEGRHRVVISAEGRDTRGQGNASANVTATLAPDGVGTTVSIDTDLNVTGKVAQFGRGVMADVSSKLLAQFAQCLANDVLAGRAGGPGDEGITPTAADEATIEAAGTGTPPEPGGVRRIDAPEAEAVDLVKAAGGAVAKRLVPAILLAAVVTALVVWLLTR